MTKELCAGLPPAGVPTQDWYYAIAGLVPARVLGIPVEAGRRP